MSILILQQEEKTMMNRKIAVSLTLIGLFAANIAFAVPGFSTDASPASIDACLAEVADKADFANARSITHNVETEDRRVAGHKMSIQTIMYSADGETVIREYASTCAVNGQDEVQRFKIRQKGML
jgi:hypothetical protein